MLHLAMHTTRHFLVAFLMCLFCGAALLNAADGDPIVGKWQSIAMGGDDIGDHIKSMTFVFRGDGTFTGSATLSDGKIETHSGKYKIADGIFEFTVKNEGTQKGAYSLTDEILTLHDSTVKSWVKFKRTAADPSDEKPAQ